MVNYPLPWSKSHPASPIKLRSGLSKLVNNDVWLTFDDFITWRKQWDRKRRGYRHMMNWRSELNAREKTNRHLGSKGRRRPSVILGWGCARDIIATSHAWLVTQDLIGPRARPNNSKLSYTWLCFTCVCAIWGEVEKKRSRTFTWSTIQSRGQRRWSLSSLPRAIWQTHHDFPSQIYFFQRFWTENWWASNKSINDL